MSTHPIGIFDSGYGGLTVFRAIRKLEAKYQEAERNEARAECWRTEDAEFVLVGYGIVGRIRAEWGRPDPFVVATGGYASTVAPHCASVQHVEPFLTLYGLAIAGRHLELKESPAQERGSEGLAAPR